MIRFDWIRFELLVRWRTMAADRVNEDEDEDEEDEGKGK
jgi:hypothetical protein